MGAPLCISTQHACDTRQCMVLGTKINRFLSQPTITTSDIRQIQLLRFIVAAAVKLYYSCVKTSSKLKIGHPAAKTTHSVTSKRYWEKNPMMHFRCKYHQILEEKMVKSQGIFVQLIGIRVMLCKQ